MNHHTPSNIVIAKVADHFGASLLDIGLVDNGGEGWYPNVKVAYDRTNEDSPVHSGPFPDLPYVVHTACYRDDEDVVVLSNGHYDLARDEALAKVES